MRGDRTKGALALALALAPCGCEAGVGDPRPQLVIVVDTDAVVQGMLLDEGGAGAIAIAIDTVRVDAIASDGSNAAYDLRTFVAPAPEDWPLSFGVAADEASFDGPVRLRIRAFAGRYALSGELAGKATLDPPPTLAIDRLIELDPPSSGVQTATVVLRADCLGRPTYFADPPTTCIDATTLRGSPRDGIDTAAAPRASEVGTWDGPEEVACSLDAPAGVDAVCVPGGISVLGDPALDGIDEFFLRATPLQPVLLGPFHLDRFEMTVGRYRALSLAGVLGDAPEPLIRNPADLLDAFCTWIGAEDASNDALPLNCVSPVTADAVCAALGGTLPTEAQWEHEARGRGRDFLYPWGDQQPDCCTTSLSRRYPGGPLTECDGEGLEPPGSHPATAACGGLGDVSLDGVHDMAGSVTEVLRDAPRPFDDVCWSPANGGGVAVDPVCVADTYERAARGGSWSSGLGTGAAALRRGSATGPGGGFRCAYAGAP